VVTKFKGRLSTEVKRKEKIEISEEENCQKSI